MKRGVYLFVSCVLHRGRATYWSGSISFSCVDYVEALGIDWSDDVGPLVLLVGVGVVSDISASSDVPWETHRVKY